MAHKCTTLGEAVVKATTLDRETLQPQQQQQQQGGAFSRMLSTRGGGRSRQQKRQSRFAEQSVVQGAEQGSQEVVCYTCETSQQRQGARRAEETGR
ncbi:hypothetical protein Taro_031585 [Colocasia esculenta]|uniref:Uncharacterized protein n=1 Tax=Colocasia esculenta TaxID=4460 RepID=A0A843VZF4_COLES|nr:hypothetical protein [Colocasia esculenta]